MSFSPVLPVLFTCFALAPLPAPSPPLPSLVDALSKAEYVNYVGEPLTLEKLKGRAVLLHFMSTNPRDEVQAKAHWPVVRKFHNDHAEKGLMILGVCSDSAGAVRAYMEQKTVPFPVAAGCNAARELGVTEPFFQILFDSKGEEYWRGPTHGLWNGKLLKGLRGSKRPKKFPLQIHLSTELSGAATKASEKCEMGELKSALATLERVLDKEDLGEAAEAEAVLAKREIEAHVELVLRQIDVLFERGEARMAMDALEMLVKELRNHELGEGAMKRLELAKNDEAVSTELEAGKRYDDVVEFYWRLGYSKSAHRFQAIVDDFPETLAAQKAANHLARR